MDTSGLKRFATEARKILKQGVSQRLSAVGFNLDGTVKEEPVLHGGGATFMGDIVSVDFYEKWKSLQHAIMVKSVKEVIEEAAYTWFNRLMAIHILAKNGLISPVLEYESEDVHIPLIVTDARHGRLPQMDEASKEKINDLLRDDSLTSEQFRMLIVAFCQSTPILNKCFGGITAYTELLLPQNILADGGFVDMINHTGFLTNDDYLTPELIGWLYQFYISERKAEVDAKKDKVETDEIPAVTQIFTPNWIVKYMVQNTVGRIYLDNNPHSADEFKSQWKYLVEPSEPTPADAIYQYEDLTDLKVADLACGSGHILNEFFDMLLQLYRNEGYSTQDAITNIFTHNITGIDIDTRAKQLSMFALLLKASQKDSSFADTHCMPHIYDMPEPYKDRNALGEVLSNFLIGSNEEVIKEITRAIRLMDDAYTLGSIMKFDISNRTRNIIAIRMEEYAEQEFVPEPIQKLMPYMRIILVLTENYSALVMNPPYIGAKKMNGVLSEYVEVNYANGKSDLCTAFMMKQAENVVKNGYYANIVTPSWMFLPSFEDLRKSIINNNVICSLLHLSRGVFGADFGSVSCVVQNRKDTSAKGTYFRLIERTFQEFDQKHLKLLFEKTLANQNFRYLFVDYNKDIKDIVYSEQGAKIYYPNISQQNFEKIPGCPIGYWVSENVLNCFDAPSLENYANAKKGLSTGDNNRFLRLWYEVSYIKTSFSSNSFKTNKKWFPINKGGTYRKWYGNNEFLINWDNDGKEIRSFKGSVIRNYSYYLKECITWSMLSSSYFGVRFSSHGKLFEGAGPSLFAPKDLYMYITSFLCSKIANFFIRIFNPTINININDVLNLPLIISKDKRSIIETKSCENISISKVDWDAHETSWDFETNELVALGDDTSQLGSLEGIMETYKTKWEAKFRQLHANEEELNRQFIEIYGLQDELTPDVPFNEITILQQGEISIVGNRDGEQIHWNDDVIIKQLISYAMGCMMGRYSIDKPGLILANQGDSLKEYQRLVPNSRFEVDDDGIVPLMPDDTEFTDNAAMRFKTWLSVTFGEDNLVKNLNYVEKCLGKKIADYFVKDFWKDHKQMYQNRPIYWLFASKKKAFQCLAYMHRMNAYTVERIRMKYLLPHIEWLMGKQNELQANAANLSAQERKELDKITSQIAECREYHDRLHVVADKQIGFDLDDGVVGNYAKFGDVLSKI